MAKKNENNSGNLVLVDAELLSQGLKAAFTGIAMVFDSLGASGAADEIKAMQEAQPAPTVPTVSQVSPRADENAQEETEDLPFDPEPKGPDKPAEPKTAADKPSPVPTVTIDDITKVIVAKIKKKRDNNARIGALLKSYGVEKVSGLPPEQYEAFLTDISAL